jgi:Cu/Ag efflux protein CusF
MYRASAATALSLAALAMWSATAFAQAKPACDAQGRVVTQQKVEGQVVKVDMAKNKLTVKETDGTVHEFDAPKETLESFKVGDKIEANLREAPKCK